MLAYIALGGILGTLARYVLQGWLQARTGLATFPVGTLAINLAGSFAIGFIVRLATGSTVITPELRAGLTIGLSDKYHGKPLYEALLDRFRAKGLAGATVLRGVAGFVASNAMHTEKVLRLSLDLPMVIEVVETEDAIQAILPDLDEMIGGGLVTLERAR